MDRRDFMKQTAAAGASPFLLGGPPAYIRSLRPGPNERVRFACIGVGGKGDSDTSDAGRHGDVVALCDVDDNTLNKMAPAASSPRTPRSTTTTARCSKRWATRSTP